MRTMKDFFILPFIVLKSLLCIAGTANAEEVTFADLSETTTDFILRNQAAILASIVLLGTIGLAWLVSIRFRGLLDRLWTETEEVARNSVPYTERLEFEIKRTWELEFKDKFKDRWLSRIVGPMVSIILVIGAGLAFLLWKSDARVLDNTDGLAQPQPLVSRQSAKAAVVFIHGWNGDDTTWRQFPKLATQDDRLQDADTYSLNYPTYMMRRSLSVGGLANWLWQDFFTGTLIPKYSEIHIIAHSMGA
jgi:hypothetical protein